MSLDNEVILITGGLGGIGAMVARYLTGKGARVIVGHRPGASVAATVPLEDGADFMPLDVRSEENWESVIGAIVEKHGKLTGLVNAAGVLVPGTEFEDVSLAQWRHHMNVNLDGSFLGCRFAMQAMSRSGGGSIVNISSGGAHIAVPTAAAYCVSKAAVLALTRLAAKAGGKHRVRVNAILPGAIDTPMLWSNLKDGQEPSDLLAQLAAMHPIGRIGEPDDIARAIAFLCDPENSFITGAMLAVDGGQIID